MKAALFAFVILPLILGSCASQDPITAQGRPTIQQEVLLEEMKQPPIRFRKVKVETRHNLQTKQFGHGNELQKKPAKQLPAMILRAGREGSVKTEREFIYPTEYDFPEILDPKAADVPGSDEASIFPVSPANPSAFEMRPVGESLTCTASSRDSFVMITGIFRVEDAGEFVQGTGIPQRPVVVQARGALGNKVEVYLTENESKQPSFVITEYPIYLAARPGEWYRIQLDRKAGTYLEIRCEVLD